MKKQIIAIFTMLILACSAASAQDYKVGLGVRGGGVMSGINAKYNFNAINSLEGTLDFVNGFNLVGLYEFNHKIAPDFNLYYGLGANIGAWSSSFVLGVDAIVGVEYLIPSVPLGISLDYKPFMNLIGYTHFHAADFGLAVRYTF